MITINLTDPSNLINTCISSGFHEVGTIDADLSVLISAYVNFKKEIKLIDIAHLSKKFI